MAHKMGIRPRVALERGSDLSDGEPRPGKPRCVRGEKERTRSTGTARDGQAAGTNFPAFVLALYVARVSRGLDTGFLLYAVHAHLPWRMNLRASLTTSRSRYSTSGARASATSSFNAAIPTDSAITLIASRFTIDIAGRADRNRLCANHSRLPNGEARSSFAFGTSPLGTYPAVEAWAFPGTAPVADALCVH
eukprot:6211903-Pleurochrysis_carterae.AAC.2